MSALLGFEQSQMIPSHHIGKMRPANRRNASYQLVSSQNEWERYKKRPNQSASLSPSPVQNEVRERRHSVARDLTKDEVAALDRVYLIRERGKVSNFLATNGFLLPLLKESAQEIRKRFGQETALVLRMSVNPDGEDRELFINIQTPLPFAEAFPLLERIDEEWWLDNASKANGKLELILEYI
jgi:hypothetical protein